MEAWDLCTELHISEDHMILCCGLIGEPVAQLEQDCPQTERSVVPSHLAKLPWHGLKCKTEIFMHI